MPTIHIQLDHSLQRAQLLNFTLVFRSSWHIHILPVFQVNCYKVDSRNLQLKEKRIYYLQLFFLQPGQDTHISHSISIKKFAY